MALPEPVEKLWRDLEAVRADVLKEVHGLSQAQADWKSGAEGLVGRGDRPSPDPRGDRHRQAHHEADA